MPFLRIFLRVTGYALYVYTAIIFLYFILTWFSGARNSKFYYVLYKICEPFERIFGGKLIVGGVLDLGGTIGLIMLSVISQFLVSISYNI